MNHTTPTESVSAESLAEQLESAWSDLDAAAQARDRNAYHEAFTRIQALELAAVRR